LLFDLVKPAAHRQDAVQRMDDRVGVEQPPHGFGGSLLPPAARVSSKMRKISSGDSPFQPPPSAMRSPRGVGLAHHAQLDIQIVDVRLHRL
jgi:hypothetical protein